MSKENDFDERLNELNTEINGVKHLMFWAEDGSFSYQDFELHDLIRAMLNYLGIKPNKLDDVERIQFVKKKK